MTERDDQKLRAFFREIHEPIDPPAPPYASMIHPDRGALSARVAPPARVTSAAPVGAALARAFGLVVVAGALLMVMREWSMRVPGDAEATRLAAEMSSWEAPTDFLLQTPGIEFFESSPRFGAGTEELPGDESSPTQEEVLR